MEKDEERLDCLAHPGRVLDVFLRGLPPKETYEHPQSSREESGPAVQLPIDRRVQELARGLEEKPRKVGV